MITRPITVHLAREAKNHGMVKLGGLLDKRVQIIVVFDLLQRPGLPGDVGNSAVLLAILCPLFGERLSIRTIHEKAGVRLLNHVIELGDIPVELRLKVLLLQGIVAVDESTYITAACGLQALQFLFSLGGAHRNIESTLRGILSSLDLFGDGCLGMPQIAIDGRLFGVGFMGGGKTLGFHCRIGKLSPTPRRAFVLGVASQALETLRAPGSG